jgi:hypothetical protein
MTETNSDNIVIIIIAVAILFPILCLTLREVYCWYCKINQRIELQKETNALLQELIDIIGGGTNLDSDNKEHQE